MKWSTVALIGAEVAVLATVISAAASLPRAAWASAGIAALLLSATVIAGALEGCRHDWIVITTHPALLHHERGRVALIYCTQCRARHKVPREPEGPPYVDPITGRPNGKPPTGPSGVSRSTR